jgi:hypothetical protein
MEEKLMSSTTQIAEKNDHQIEFKVNMTLNDLINALKSLNDEDREFVIENLLAALSPNFLKSIEEARRDYREGRVVSFEEAFK